MSAPRAALLCLLCLLCLLPGSLQLKIHEFVVPNAVEVGKDVELRCKYQLEGNETEDAIYVKWWWTPDSGAGDERVQLYQRIAGHNAQALHHNNTSQIEIKGNDSIVLQDVKPVDSGTYECEVSNNIDKELRSHETLIVFSMGTGPALNYTLISEAKEKEDNLLLECEAGDVAPFPNLTIVFQGEAIETSTIVEENENGLYKIFVNGTVSIAGDNEEEIRCELAYDSVAHPPYVDVKKFKPAGRDALPSTEPPEDATEPDPTHNSLQNPSDDGIRVHCSWAMLALAVVVTHFQATL